MSVAITEPSTIVSDSPRYTSEFNSETRRLIHALAALRHPSITRLNDGSSARRIANAVITAFAFPAAHNADHLSRMQVAVQQAELMLPPADLQRHNACALGIGKARHAILATYAQ